MIAVSTAPAPSMPIAEASVTIEPTEAYGRLDDDRALR